MKNSSKIITSFFVALLVLSCSKDETPIPTGNHTVIQDTPKSEYKLKKIEDIQNGVVIKTSEFEYNSSGNISKTKVADRNKTIEVTYNYDQNNDIVTWNQTETSSFDPEFKITQVNTLEYNNGKISNICIDRKTFDWSTETLSKDKIEFTYGPDSNPISIKHFEEMTYDSFNPRSCADVIYLSNEETFENVNGNTVKYSSGDDSFFSNNYNLIEYDDKINPYSTLKPEAFRIVVSGLSAKNNKTKITIHNASDDSLQATAVYENTYNSANYLIQTIEKYYYAGQSIPATTTIVKYYYY
ncbi:MAG: hypothetical protein H6584_00505 [Flavobacteriales bacterium]|nr:hypothetical protein [Flavobacteriales bacterium]